MTNLKNRMAQMKKEANAGKDVEKAADQVNQTLNAPVTAEQASKPQHVASRRLKIASTTNGEWYKEFEGITKDYSLKSGTSSVFEVQGGQSGLESIAVYAPSEKQMEFGVVANVSATLAFGGIVLRGMQVTEYEDLNLGLRVPSRESNGKYYDHYELSSLVKAQILHLVDTLLED